MVCINFEASGRTLEGSPRVRPAHLVQEEVGQRSPDSAAGRPSFNVEDDPLEPQVSELEETELARYGSQQPPTDIAENVQEATGAVTRRTRLDASQRRGSNSALSNSTMVQSRVNLKVAWRNLLTEFNARDLGDGGQGGGARRNSPLECGTR